MYNEKERKEMEMMTKILMVLRVVTNQDEFFRTLRLPDNVIQTVKNQSEINIKTWSMEIYKAIKDDLK